MIKCKLVVYMLFKNKKFFKASGYDFMLVGLGNPGAKYENTRHNCGFLALDVFASRHGGDIKKSKFQSLIGECTVGGKRILLVKPQTFMNNSGIAVKAAMDFYKIAPENIVIAFDDISLDPGKIRMRRKGSDGGHNGIKSIIAHISSQDFPRIKIGVGAKPTPEWDLANWVLSGFDKKDLPAVKDSLEKAADAAECIFTQSIDVAMNKYNS